MTTWPMVMAALVEEVASAMAVTVLVPTWGAMKDLGHYEVAEETKTCSDDHD
jgi:hypothetical protein